jgi:hypothetical protein
MSTALSETELTHAASANIGLSPPHTHIFSLALLSLLTFRHSRARKVTCKCMKCQMEEKPQHKLVEIW